MCVISFCFSVHYSFVCLSVDSGPSQNSDGTVDHDDEQTSVEVATEDGKSEPEVDEFNFDVAGKPAAATEHPLSPESKSHQLTKYVFLFRR